MNSGDQSSLQMVAIRDGRVDVLAYGLKINMSVNQVKEGYTLPLPTPVTIKVGPQEDELQNYTINFLNWYFILIVMHDTISEGNIELMNTVLKFMIPLFYKHSRLSKYMSECIDFILKTEFLLTPRVSLKVKAGAFVNISGKIGGNKALGDLEQTKQRSLLLKFRKQRL